MRGVHLHIPFCKNICSYCDFFKFLYNEEWANTYLDFLNQEINEYYEGDKIQFDYKIRPGKCTSTNAKYLMEKLNII